MTNTNKKLTSQIDHIIQNLEEKGQPAEELEPLDVKLETSLDQIVREITLITATGGPHIEIDLFSATIKAFWGSDKEIYSIDMASEQAQNNFESLKHFWIDQVEDRGFEV